MTLKEKLKEDLKQAMRADDLNKKNTIRNINTAITVFEKSGKEERQANDDEILACIRKLSKQSKDSIAMFEKEKRQDLVIKEKAELEILNTYLPADLTDDELKNIIDKVLLENSEELQKYKNGDVKMASIFIGKTMKATKGRAEPVKVNTLLKQKLDA